MERTGNNNNTREIDTLFSSANSVEQRFDMPFPDRKGEVRVVSNNDIVIIDSSSRTEHPTASWQHINERPFLELNFMLEGSMYQSQGSLLKKQRFNKGYYNLLFSPGTVEQSEFIGSGCFRNVGIHISPERAKVLFTEDIPEMKHLALKIETGDPFLFQAGAAGMNGQIKYLLETLWSPAAAPGLARLHFEAYNLELFSLVCGSFINRENRKAAGPIHPADRDKLYYARELLLSNLADPPTIRELAALCTLNEFKLKKGFRQLFGMGILAFVNEQRLQSARIAIYLNEKTISEIAYELGFAHTQHFHRAFKKRFGETPKSLNKN